MEQINVQVDQIGSNEPTPIITTDALELVVKDELNALLLIIGCKDFETEEQQAWLISVLDAASNLKQAWQDVEKQDFEVDLEVRGECVMTKTLTRTFTASSLEEAEEMAREEFEDDPETYIYNSGENLIDEAAETWELYGAEYELD